METELILELQKLMEDYRDEMKEFREEVKEFREQWKSQADSTGDDTDEDEDLTVVGDGAEKAYYHDDSHFSDPEHSDDDEPDDDVNCDDSDVPFGAEFVEDENGLNADIDETDVVVLEKATESTERKNRKTHVSAPELFDECHKREYVILTPILTSCSTNTMTSSVDTSKKVLIVYVLQPNSEILFEITKLDSSHDWGGVVLWNSMIGEHVTNNEVLEAFKVYTKMREFGTKESTFISLLSAYCTTGDLSLSKQVHSHACKFGVVNNLIVATGLVDMYAKCRCTNDACRLFGELEMYDTVLLNSMITIYFSMISACVNISPLELGEQHFVLEGNLLMLAGSTLLKQVTENSLSVQLRLDIRNYVNSYLASRGPELQSFVTASLIQLLCRGWFDDDRFKEVVKDSMHFLSQATSDHYAIGLKILNQLVYEMNQLNTGFPSTRHRRVACSFRDQSLYQLFQISLTSPRQLKTDVVSRLQAFKLIKLRKEEIMQLAHDLCAEFQALGKPAGIQLLRFMATSFSERMVFLRAVHGAVVDKWPTKIKELLDNSLLEGLTMRYMWESNVRGYMDNGLYGIVKGDGILCYCDRYGNRTSVNVPTLTSEAYDVSEMKVLVFDPGGADSSMLYVNPTLVLLFSK